jgi:hypothetical protein
MNPAPPVIKICCDISLASSTDATWRSAEAQRDVKQSSDEKLPPQGPPLRANSIPPGPVSGKGNCMDSQCNCRGDRQST